MKPHGRAFRRAMQLVGSAVRDGRSQAAYLHGSFGSGKSHFKAILTLAFEGHEAAVGIPELHPVLAARPSPRSRAAAAVCRRAAF